MRAHLYWIRISDEPRGKRRPAVVLSPDVRNRLANDVIVAPVSSVMRPAPTHVRLRAGEGGLDRASMVKCEQVTTLRKERLLSRPLGGGLSLARMVEIEKAVLRAIGVPVV